jgi:glycosidase
MDDFGCDVSDYRDVDPMFGTLADFDTLVAEAHKLGIKIMIDLVLPLASDQHAWFKESRVDRNNSRNDWYVWADPKPDGTALNNWLSIFGGPAWQWDTRREQYYMHIFLTSQPDLNYHNPAVQDAVLDVAHFWLQRSASMRSTSCGSRRPMSAPRSSLLRKPECFTLTMTRRAQTKRVGDQGRPRRRTRAGLLGLDSLC